MILFSYSKELESYKVVFKPQRGGFGRDKSDSRGGIRIGLTLQYSLCGVLLSLLAGEGCGCRRLCSARQRERDWKGVVTQENCPWVTKLCCYEAGVQKLAIGHFLSNLQLPSYTFLIGHSTISLYQPNTPFRYCHSMLSDSATAGVGVGSGVAGLAIGATVCFLYFTRWKRDRDHGHKHREQTTPDNELNKLQLLSQMLDTASPTLWEECITLYKNNLATHLPQHMYAGRIKEEIGNIYHKLLRYENDFIVPQTPRPRLDRAAMLKLIGPRHVDQLLELVQNEDQGNAKKALVIIFNMAIMSRLDFNGDPDATLLPPDVLRFYQGLLQSAEANGEAHGNALSPFLS